MAVPAKQLSTLVLGVLIPFEDTVKDRLRAMNPLLKEESRETTRIIVDKLAQLGWGVSVAAQE